MTAHPDDTWLVVADAGRARIFKTDAELEQLVEIEDLLHPGARLKTSELASDRPGRTNSGSSARSAVTKSDPHEQEEVKAARAVARYLEEAHAGHRFRDLVLVASPVFLGRLRAELRNGAGRAVTATVDRDYSHLPGHEIRALVKRQLESQPLLK